MAGPLTLMSHEVAGYESPAIATHFSPAPPQLQKRLNEAFAGWPQTWQVWQDLPNTPYGYPASGFAWSRGGTGTTTDRQGGRDIPFIWSEIDLRGFRVLSRFLAETNPYAIGFLGNLVNYHIRRGFAWQVCRKGAKKTPYPTIQTDDPVVARGQAVIDQWRDKNKWSLLSREAFYDWRVDGEKFLRHFPQGHGNLPEIRFVLPEQIGHPAGDVTSEESFGILKPPGDQAGPTLAYHVWDMDGGQAIGGWIDADEMHSIKCNVSSFVKRGRPDLFPLQDMLDSVRELLVNMVGTAVEQSKWAWIEKYPTASADQVAALIPKFSGGMNPNGLGQAGFPYEAFFRNRGGKIRGVEGNRQLEPGPAASPSGWIEAMQAILRACGIRWNFPEFFSGDASNNSFASALVSGSPLTVTIEGTQQEWGEGFERPVALRVLDLAANAGLLTWEERRQLDVEITEPAVVTPKPGEETSRRAQMNQSKVLSRTTWQLQEQLDPQHETANFEQEAKQDAAMGGGASPSATSPTPTPGGPSPEPAPPGSANGDGSGESEFLGESIFLSEGAYHLLSEAGRVGLVKKSITNKDGDKQTVWVKPGGDEDSGPQPSKQGREPHNPKKKFKYPRTWHLPWSEGLTTDDRKIESIEPFVGKEVVVTEKMDGENTTLSREYIHARSLDSGHHPSRDPVKAIWGTIRHDIPEGWRICGENLYGKHSIGYEGLKSPFLVFAIYNEKNVSLSWSETIEYAHMLGLQTVPVLYHGEFDEEKVKNCFKGKSTAAKGEQEGYVMRLAGEFHYDDQGKSMAKFVRAGHVQSEDHWQKNWKPNNFQPIEDKIAESFEISEGFSGIKTDKNGAKRKYVNGKEVPLNDLTDAKSTNHGKNSTPPTNNKDHTIDAAAQKMAVQAREIVKKIKPSKERAYGSKQTTKLDSRLAGAIGEEIIIQHLKSLGYADAGPTSDFMNTTRNNLPMDLVHDHRLIEAKAGQADNPDGVWALKYDGRFTKEQEAAFDKMKPDQVKEAKKKINVAKVKGIHDRKAAFIKKVNKKLGFKVAAGMMTVILNPDTKTADIYQFDGLHDRIAFKSEMAQSGYIRSVKYG